MTLVYTLPSSSLESDETDIDSLEEDDNDSLELVEKSAPRTSIYPKLFFSGSFLVKNP